MPVFDWQAAEEMLAKLVARAFAADYPELFVGRHGEGRRERDA
jgi:hypothetical protein